MSLYCKTNHELLMKNNQTHLISTKPIPEANACSRQNKDNHWCDYVVITIIERIITNLIVVIKKSPEMEE